MVKPTKSFGLDKVVEQMELIRNCLTSGRHDASSPSTQLAAATKYGGQTETENNGSTRVWTKVVVYVGFCSLRNCYVELSITSINRKFHYQKKS